MFEAWSDGVPPPYSVQTTSLRPGTPNPSGISWADYGGNVGVWRILRSLEAFGIPGTFCTSARAAEKFPDAVKQIVRSGHDIAGHGYYQDELLPYVGPENELSTITRCLDTLESISGVRPRGWFSPVLATTATVVDNFIAAGLEWHGDANDVDLPVIVERPHGSIVAIPASEYTDNRVLRGHPSTFGDLYIDTFDFLDEREPGALLVFTLHAHFGCRPLVIAAFERALRHIAAHSNVWFASHLDIARHVVEHGAPPSYRERYFQTVEPALHRH
jgi:peptidoglycan/xylan/chitin deacetylase (PgdA/CDA1 family)